MATVIPQMNGMPDDGDGPVFRAPWEAKAFAVAVQLSQKGLFTWTEWAETFSTEIKRAEGEREFKVEEDDGSRYYYIWLTALEKMLETRDIVAHEELDERHQYLIDNPVPHDHVAHRKPICVA
ncbi:nitrile hydratase accessory protein [compost metagenome]